MDQETKDGTMSTNDQRPMDVDTSSTVPPKGEEEKDDIDRMVIPSEDGVEATADLSTPKQSTRTTNVQVLKGQGKADEGVQGRTSSQEARIEQEEKEEVILGGPRVLGSSTLMTDAETVPLEAPIADGTPSAIDARAAMSNDGVPSSEVGRSTIPIEGIMSRVNLKHLDDGETSSTNSDDSHVETKQLLSLSALHGSTVSEQMNAQRLEDFQRHVMKNVGHEMAQATNESARMLQQMQQTFQQTLIQQMQMVQQQQQQQQTQMYQDLQYQMSTMMATVETMTNMNESRTTSVKTTGLRETESVDGKEKNSTRPPLVAQAEDKSQNRIQPSIV
jgi:hypothetical protein